MNNLLKCSKTLYNQELSEKIKELRKYEVVIKPNNIQEWENKVAQMFNNLQNKLNESINTISELFRYGEIAITSVLHCHIVIIIKNCLYFLTNNKEWSEHMAVFHFGLGLEGFLHSLMDTININDIFEPQDIINMIYKNIKFQLDDGKYPCILSDYIMLELKCNNCKTISNYVNENNLCFDCEEK
jgi:hypothetical protein